MPPESASPERLFLHGADQLVGPLTGPELRARQVGPSEQLRRGTRGRWRSLASLICVDPTAVELLEDGLEPDEPSREPWQGRSVAPLAWVLLLQVVGALWVLVDALGHRGAYAAWTTAAVVVVAAALSIQGVMLRRPWGFALGALLSGAFALRLLVMAVASASLLLSALGAIQAAATVFLVLRRPRGPALLWSPGARRLLLAYSSDPGAEARRLRPVRLAAGPVTALVAVVFVALVVLAGVWLYHRLRFPELSLPLSLVPRGGWPARAISMSIYLMMASVAWGLRGRPVPAFDQRLVSVAIPALRVGAVAFLFLALALLVGRWSLHLAELLGDQLAPGGEALALGHLRAAVEQAVPRETNEGELSLLFALWYHGLVLALGPICEELFFRGLVFAGLRQRWPFWAAALGSSLLFALAHGPGSGWGLAAPLLLVEITLGGLATAWAYETSRSLLAPITLHVLWNTLQEAAALSAGTAGVAG